MTRTQKARQKLAESIQAKHDYIRAVISERDQLKDEMEDQGPYINKLRDEIAGLRDHIHTCGPTCVKAGCVNSRLRKELAELKLAYAECSRQKNELLTKHKQMAKAEPVQEPVAWYGLGINENIASVTMIGGVAKHKLQGGTPLYAAPSGLRKAAQRALTALEEFHDHGYDRQVCADEIYELTEALK